ncbi:unnamed protein product [Effrenium voratum]|nr:unnamed protein product [Effrenium voratum]
MRATNLLPILAFLSQVPRPLHSNDFVEVCSGCGKFSEAMRDSGFVGKEFDICHSGNHDLLRSVGFLAILAAVRNTKRGGVLMLAPPCSTWVFLSRSYTGRSWACPEGRKIKAVILANILIHRLLYIIFYATKRGVYWLVEQPISSVLWVYEPVRRILNWARARRISFPMGAYGARTLKMSVLWGTLPNLTSLRRPLSFKLLKEACDRRDNALVKKTICKRTGRVTVAAWIEGLVDTQRNIMRRSRLDAVTASESRLRTPLRLAMQSQHWWGNGSCQQMRT